MNQPCPSIVIRPATAADIESMRALERSAAQMFHAIGYDFCADGPVRDADEHLRVIETGVTLVAETKTGSLAGFAMVEPMDGEAHLVEIDVAPLFQRQGLARRLIAGGADWSRSKGFDGMTLTTYRDVPWNAPYYRRLGFVEFKPGPGRSGLIRTINQEAAWGFDFRPRIAMRKTIL